MQFHRVPIQAGDLRNLIPHESKTVTMTLTGAQILEILEQSLENTCTDSSREKVSGLRFKYHPENFYPHRITEATVNGKNSNVSKAIKSRPIRYWQAAGTITKPSWKEIISKKANRNTRS